MEDMKQRPLTGLLMSICVHATKPKTHPAPYRVLNIICPLIVLGTSKSICTSYLDGLSNPSLYSSPKRTNSRYPILANRLMSKSQAVARHRSGIPLYTRSRSFDSFDGRIRHVSILPPGSREAGCSIRVHFAIRKFSLSGWGDNGSVLSEMAVAETEGGPAETGANRFVKGAAFSRINRSCEGIVKKP